LFNRDVFGKKDDEPRADPRSANVTPALGSAAPVRHTPPATDRGAVESFKQAAPAEELAGSRLIVGPDIKLKGVEITDCDTLVVEGRVEASMDSRVVQIAQHGVFTGTATMDVAEIWGTFEGTLTARKQLVIYATGRVSGHIRYGKIRVEEGGELSGEVSTLAGDGATAAAAKPAERVGAPAPGELKGTAYEPVRTTKPLGKAGSTV
jgi:cytoskeletal protein CcmA (bactofilin family)